MPLKHMSFTFLTFGLQDLLDLCRLLLVYAVDRRVS